MKKILYITFLLFTCISCNEHINDTTDLQYNLYNVKFDGHLYVIYREKEGHGLGAAMVHSPNCECYKEKLNDEKIN